MDFIKNLWASKVARRVIFSILGLVIVIFLIRSCNSIRHKSSTTADDSAKVVKKKKVALTQFEEEQKQLIKRYGDAGKGYYWSDDGKRLALGNQNLTEREVVTAFVRAISTLDFATAQKYAYKDQVLKTMNQYFDKDATFTYDESFKKSMYQQVLLSLEYVGIENQSTFADDKANLTVKLRALDLSNKDFWKVDREEIFQHLYQFKKSESDSTKARNYLYDYVTSYWKSEEAKKHTITVNFTLIKTGTGGWLVAKDDDLDNYAKYVEGETVINNIISSYDEWSSDESNLDKADSVVNGSFRTKSSDSDGSSSSGSSGSSDSKTTSPEDE